jgi:hypothetical protein
MVDNLLLVKAEEILDKIEKAKPVEYENIIIFGDLDLHRLDLPRDKNKRKIVASIIKIEYSEIKGDVFFDNSVFNQLVDFDGTVFNKAANFSKSHFRGDAGFSDAQFLGEASFLRCHFSVDANFSRAKFNDADFGQAAFERNFLLNNSKIYTLRLSDAHFMDGSNIHLKDFNFNRIQVRWNTLKGHVPFNGSVYLTLTKNFRNLEQFEDEDQCYYRYRREKQSRQGSRKKKLIDWLVWLSCGYGVRPSHTIILSFAVILFFGVFYWAGNALIDVRPPGENAIGSISFGNAIYFSSMEFLGRSPQNLNVLVGYEILTIVETLVGWLLMALFLVTLSKVMLR